MIKKRSNQIYGEFECGICKKIFHIKSQLDAHKGIHTRESSGPPKCSNCKITLIAKKNWHKSLMKQSKRMCKKCVRQVNKNAYLNRKKKKMEGK
jgi:hypothetical protein